MSDSSVKSRSCSSPGGSSSRLKSAHGTRRYSACPPRYGPICGYPYPAPGCPDGLARRHADVHPSVQLRQVPQARLNGTDTRSPTLTRFTPGPGLLDDAHVLVPEHHARLQRRPPLVGVQVRPADVRGRDADDRVSGLLDLRIVDVLDRELERPLEHDSLHDPSPFSCGLATNRALPTPASVNHFPRRRLPRGSLSKSLGSSREVRSSVRKYLRSAVHDHSPAYRQPRHGRARGRVAGGAEPAAR